MIQAVKMKLCAFSTGNGSRGLLAGVASLLVTGSLVYALPSSPIERSVTMRSYPPVLSSSDEANESRSTNPIMRATPRNSPYRQPSSYVYPVMSPRLTSAFGRRIHPIKRFSRQHQGIDLAAPIGSPIRAIASGTVVFADPYAGYGNLVVVKHGGGMTSHYAHCSSIKVRTGDRVRAGQIIAAVGSSGHSTGPHLHLEIRINGEAKNPESYIPGLADTAEG